jgi:hypothetical protein
MGVHVEIMVAKRVVGSAEYDDDANVPIPNIGDIVINPQTAGQGATVRRRIFNYEDDDIHITLDCE